MTGSPAVVEHDRPLDVAVIGSGISGLAAAWLLSKRHRVTVFEADARIGGHSHTLEVAAGPVDTGFIVYNAATYPNLTALFRHLQVPTKPSDMSFGVSLDDGRLEYSSNHLFGLFAQPRNLVSARFWSMLCDLLRFYRDAPRDLGGLDGMSLDDYLRRAGFGAALRADHLLPMAAAIWSTPAGEVGRYPAAAFIRFCNNHGLLKIAGRPKWRTVDGGSREYVKRLTASFAHRIDVGCAIRRVRRFNDSVELVDAAGLSRRFDHAIIATHADQALALLTDADNRERRLLGAFRYTRNDAILHNDAGLMPRRRAVWSSWNYLSSQGSGSPSAYSDQVESHDRQEYAQTQYGGACPYPKSGIHFSEPCSRLSVTYWMNRLQSIPDPTPLFVTLNPHRDIEAEHVLHRQVYEHPLFDTAALAAQELLWSLQGVRNTWFCGAYFGAGFHEDGLQAGLAVAEELGGVKRPWRITDESARIHVRPRARPLVPAFAS